MPQASYEIRGDNEMKNALNSYIDSLFVNAPKTQPVKELHDEILTNLSERYDDCIAAGMSPQRAYTAVIDTMGDINSLIEQVSGNGVHSVGLFEQASPKKRLFEKYKDYFTEDDVKTIKGAAVSIMWLLIVIIYFVFSFLFRAWAWSWVIFIVGAAINTGISIFGKLSELKKKGDSPKNKIKMLKVGEGGVSTIMWLSIVIVYLVISSVFRIWHISWLIFIFGAIMQIVLSTVFKIVINKYKREEY